MSHFTFEYPLAFLLIILFFVCLKFCKRRFEAIFFPGSNFLKSAAKKEIGLNNLLRFLIMLLLTTALASPVVEDKVVVLNDKGYDIALILDASGSMAEYHKFDIVKSIVTKFIKKREHDRIGLTIFGDFAYVAVPLTYDKNSLLRLLKRIDVGIAGTHQTALYEALFMSTRLFKDSHAKNKIAILLTDGMDNASSIPLDVAINTAKKYGIKVYTIGVGESGDFDPYVLAKIAKESGGKFFKANSAGELRKIYEDIDKLEKSKIKADKYVKKSYLFMWPLGAAFLLMVILMLLLHQ